MQEAGGTRSYHKASNGVMLLQCLSEHEIYVNNIHKCRSYLTENMMCVHYKDQPIKVI